MRNKEQFEAAGINPDTQKWVRFGRPDLKKIFEEVRSLCTEEDIHRVGVCVCGPASLVTEVDNLCRESVMKPTCSTIRFDCHKEVFDF